MDSETRQVARHGPGPVYDNSLRWLVSTNLRAVCRWLGVDPGEDPVLVSESLSAMPMYTDLLVRTAPDRLVHVEFVRRVEPDLPARMLEYRARIMRSRPAVTLVQHVLVLAEGVVPSRLGDEEHAFRLHVTYLREHEPGEFLVEAPLAPLAVLARAGGEAGRRDNLREALRVILTADSDRSQREGRATTASTLAAIHLSGRTIKQTWKEAGMPLFTKADVEKLFVEMGFYPDEEERARERALEIKAEIKAEVAEQVEAEVDRRLTRGLEAVLQRRFGDDDRIGPVAALLALEPLEKALALVEGAPTLSAVLSGL